MRDGKTGFTFFNIEGHQYHYDADAQLLSITGGRLLISEEFAKRSAGHRTPVRVVGKISVGAAMQPIEIRRSSTAKPNRWSCRLAQAQPVAKRRHCARARCHRGRSARQWRNLEVLGTLVGLARGNDFLQQRRPGVQLVCVARTPIIPSFRKICIE